MLDGSLDLTVDGDTRRLLAGQAATIPAGMTHAALTIDGCRAIVVDHPARHEVAGTTI